MMTTLTEIEYPAVEALHRSANLIFEETVRRNKLWKEELDSINRENERIKQEIQDRKWAEKHERKLAAEKHQSELRVRQLEADNAAREALWADRESMKSKSTLAIVWPEDSGDRLGVIPFVEHKNNVPLVGDLWFHNKVDYLITSRKWVDGTLHLSAVVSTPERHRKAVIDGYVKDHATQPIDSVKLQRLYNPYRQSPKVS